MKIHRLLAIVTLLMSKKLISASELAKKFEVSIRTIQRDIDSLCASGIPIVSEAGARGGYSIIKEYKFDKQLVTSDDLFFILTSLESIGVAYQNSEISMTMEKIKSLLSDYQAEEINKLKSNLYIDFSSLGSDHNKSISSYIKLIEEAIAKNKLLDMSYYDAKGNITKRLIEPMTIAFKWYSWYLFGFCTTRDDYRLFRISRIENCTLTDNRFTRRKKNIEEYFKEHDNFEKKSCNNKIILKFHPTMKKNVQDYFEYCQQKTLDNDYIQVNIQSRDISWIKNMVLSYGNFVEVIEPATLRESIKSILEDTLMLYKRS